MPSAETKQPGVLRSAANVALSATSNLKTALGVGVTAKDTQLQQHTRTVDGSKMTTEAGVPIAEDSNSLKAGERGPTLIEDFQFRDKMAHFDRERIPERVVHARGFGAHGVFEVGSGIGVLKLFFDCDAWRMKVWKESMGNGPQLRGFPEMEIQSNVWWP